MYIEMVQDHDLRANGNPAAPDFSVRHSARFHPFTLCQDTDHVANAALGLTARIPRLPLCRPAQRWLHLFPIRCADSRFGESGRAGQ